jgi:hypothetical protein
MSAQRTVPQGYAYISTGAEINETKQRRLGNVVQLYFFQRPENEVRICILKLSFSLYNSDIDNYSSIE